MTLLARRPWVLVGLLAVACALLGGMLIARPAAGSEPGARPELRVAAEAWPDAAAFVPTITVYFADGTRGDGSAALKGPWRPDRPVRMVTVVASVSCSIQVDDVLTVSEGAAVNRVAVCVWTAP